MTDLRSATFVKGSIIEVEASILKRNLIRQGAAVVCRPNLGPTNLNKQGIATTH